MKKSVDAVALLALALVFIASSALAQNAQTAAPTVKAKGQPKVLDLKPPDITKSPTLKRIALGQSQRTPERIEVVGSPELLPQSDSELPRPWMGPAAVIWGLIHPLSAWRIVAPVSEEVTRQTSGPPNLDYEVLRMSMQ